MILSASAISTSFKKVSLTTAGIASLLALSTAGASAATIINSTVTFNEFANITGTFSASDIITLNASGTVDNLEAFGPDGYTTNAAGIVTQSSVGFEPGSASPRGFGTFNSGALLISAGENGTQQVFASNEANGFGSSQPSGLLSRTTTLGDIFGSGFTTASVLQFQVEPFFDQFSQATTGGFISSVPSRASVPNVYTLTGSISQAGATDVPEPFTIVGTLIGGTAALRMRKKLKANNN